uniref:Putative polysaccharide pyruvyl transferase family protein n=1 Tax=viral metagenome TaxID=1070528 RepID=A0A6M3M021_9ZZZZ
MSLRELFEEIRGGKAVFIAPGGNQGDWMIYLGADKLADQAGLKRRAVLYKKERHASVHVFGKHKILYLHGGGGFNSWWNWTPWLLRMLREANPRNRIIIGPTTVDVDRDYLDRVLDMDSKMTFFARERTTFDIMQDYCTDVRLDHDTALHLRYGDGYMQRLVGDLKPRKDFSLLVLRRDMERDQVPSCVKMEDFKIVEDPCWHKEWAKVHMHASRIVSNRSHSAIMGAVLGKDTSIFAGSYHKNRSIYDYSLKDMGVKWLE